MAIVLQTPYVPSVPSYDKIHLDYITITREKTDYAKTSIQARVRPYHEDSAGKKTFCPDATEIYIEDAEAWAIEKAQTLGDTRGIDATNHIKAIVALLTEYKTALGAASVS